MDLVLLINPVARAGTAPAIADRAIAMLHERGIDARVLAGASPAESAALVRGAVADGADAVAVCGGDGTVSLAVRELAGSGVPLGVIPAGTGNDIAAALGVADLPTAVAAIADRRTRRIDLARATRSDGTTVSYATVLASGFDSRVNDRANRMTWPRGGSRYTIAILAEVLRLEPIPYRIDLDLPGGDTLRVEEDLIMAAVANGPSYGGGVRIDPDARLDDGLLEVVLVRPVSRARLVRLLPRVYAGTHVGLPEVSVHRVRGVRLSAPGVTAYADGDAVGPLPLTIDAVPGALDVLVPDA